MIKYKSATVRVEDPQQRKELREWLKVIRHEFNHSIYDGSFPIIAAYVHAHQYVYSGIPSDISIDCGTNIQMFKALAALRDDSDYMQWFITTKGKWVLSKYKYKRHNSLYAGRWKQTCHKADITEIIEHFKNKK